MNQEILELRLEYNQGYFANVSALCPFYETDELFSKKPTSCVWYAGLCANPDLLNINNTNCRFKQDKI